MGRIIAGILLFLVLVGAIAGIAGFAYQAGMAQGAAAPVVNHAGYAFWYPFPFVGLFSLLIPLFLLFVAFGAVRMLLWGVIGGHYLHREHMGGRMHGRFWNNGDVPPMFREWHRRVHETPDEPAPKA